MTAQDDFEDDSARELTDLRGQISLPAGGTRPPSAAVASTPSSSASGEAEQVYTLTSADRPYRVIVESMGEGAATVSERGVILFANAQLARFLDVDRDSMVGRDLSEYVGEGQREALDTLLSASSTDTARGELLVKDADGVDVPFLVSATDIDLDGSLVRCLVLTDLTMQKLVERQLAAEAAQIERQRVAAEVNDTIVQGLVAAEMALDLGQVDYARNLVASTSRQARDWIGQLAGDHRARAGHGGA